MWCACIFYAHCCLCGCGGRQRLPRRNGGAAAPSNVFRVQQHRRMCTVYMGVECAQLTCVCSQRLLLLFMSAMNTRTQVPLPVRIPLVCSWRCGGYVLRLYACTYCCLLCTWGASTSCWPLTSASEAAVVVAACKLVAVCVCRLRGKFAGVCACAQLCAAGRCCCVQHSSVYVSPIGLRVNGTNANGIQSFVGLRVGTSCVSNR